MALGKDRARFLASSGTVPWLNYEAVIWLYENARPDWKVFEWGSGASTFWLARHCGLVMSVDHDREWASTVLRQLNSNAITNVMTYLYNDAVKKPVSYVSAVFKKYEPEHFDLIIVDGVQRPRCAQAAIPMVKPGGYMILDNSEKNHIKPACDHVPDTWDRMDFFGDTRRDPTRPARNRKGHVQTQTTIWRKPE